MSAPTRKLAAKRFNEHIKLLMGSFNTVALTIFGAAFLLPYLNGNESHPSLFWILVAIVLHLAAHIAVRFTKSEE
jgi:hypothetical protein